MTRNMKMSSTSSPSSFIVPDTHLVRRTKAFFMMCVLVLILSVTSFLLTPSFYASAEQIATHDATRDSTNNNATQLLGRNIKSMVNNRRRSAESSYQSSSINSLKSSDGKLFSNTHTICPANCLCDVISSKKRVSCTKGSLTAIPTDKMDRDTQVI